MLIWARKLHDRIALEALGCRSAPPREPPNLSSRTTCHDSSRRGEAVHRSDPLLKPPAMLWYPVFEATVDTEFVRPMMRDIGVELRLAANRDKIGLPVLKDGFGLLSLENDADGHGGDIRLFANTLGIGNLESEAAWHLSRRGRTGDTARGAVDHIHAAQLQLARKSDRIIHVPTLLGAVDGRDAQEQRH